MADGTYTGPGNVDIDFNGKNITVTSQNGHEATIIDCGGFASTDGSGNHRGFYLHSGETNAAISGFTVKNGYQTYNSDVTDSGRGIYLKNTGTGTLTLTNCIVTANTADNFGGGVSNYNSGSGTLALTNCIVYSDTHDGLITEGINVTLPVSHCDIQGGFAGTDNLDADPKFASAPTDLHLLSTSPCLVVGTTTGALTTTIDGKMRPNPPSIGAYEQGNSVAPVLTHVLWTNTNRTALVWNHSPGTGGFMQASYGPYSGWSANGLADGSDGKVRLLWNNVSGQASFWSLDTATGLFGQFSLGPYGGWTATAIAGG